MSDPILIKAKSARELILKSHNFSDSELRSLTFKLESNLISYTFASNASTTTWYLAVREVAKDIFEVTRHTSIY